MAIKTTTPDEIAEKALRSIHGILFRIETLKNYCDNPVQIRDCPKPLLEKLRFLEKNFDSVADYRQRDLIRRLRLHIEDMPHFLKAFEEAHVLREKDEWTTKHRDNVIDVEAGNTTVSCPEYTCRDLRQLAELEDHPC